MCAKSPHSCNRGCRKRAPTLSRKSPSSLSRAARSSRPKAEPMPLPPVTGFFSDGQWASRSLNASRDVRHDCAGCGAPNDEGSLTQTGSQKARITKCDSSHRNDVSTNQLLGCYHVAQQCVTGTGDFSSSQRRTLTAQPIIRRLSPRGPDNGTPVERPVRKAPRLTRANSRHASRAAERSFWRGT